MRQYKTYQEIEVDRLEGTNFDDLVKETQWECIGQINDILIEMLEIMREQKK